MHSQSLITYDEAYGPLTQLWAGTSPETAEMNGKVCVPLQVLKYRPIVYRRLSLFQYLIPWARLGTAGKSGRDPQLSKELWTWLDEQIAQNA